MAARRIPVLPTNKVVDLLFQSMQHVHSGDLHNTAECHICNEPFLTGQHPERPVILRCGHILGEGCILKWMSPLSRNGRQNTCPLCRRTLLEVGAVGVPTTDRTRSGNYGQTDRWHQLWVESRPILILLALVLFIQSSSMLCDRMRATTFPNRDGRCSWSIS